MAQVFKLRWFIFSIQTKCSDLLMVLFVSPSLLPRLLMEVTAAC